MELHLDHSVALAGCHVKGVVLVTIRNFSGKPAVQSVTPEIKNVQIVLEGQERTVTGRPADGLDEEKESQSYTVPLIRLKLAIHLPERLSRMENVIFATTTFGMPFEMKVPRHLPSSMHCSVSDDNVGSFCEITYQVTAYCHFQSTQTQEITKIASNTQVLWILAHPRPPRSPKFTERATGEFQITACCVKRGYIKLGVSLENCSAVISPHSILDVNILGRNCSSVPVRHLTAILREVIQWRVGRGGSEFQSKVRTLNEATIVVNNSWAQQWQALPSQSLHCRPSKPDTLGSVPSSWSSIHNRKSKSLEVRWTIPSDIRDSYQGQAIEVRHSVVVKAITSRAWCANSPELAYPIHVQRPPIESCDEGSAFDFVGGRKSLTSGNVSIALDEVETNELAC